MRETGFAALKEFFGVSRVLPMWAEEAKEKAIKRRDFHQKYQSKRHWYDANKGEYADEIYGNIAQIAFRELLKSNYPLSVLDFAPLFTEDLQSLPDYDARINKWQLEVKGIPPDSETTTRKRLLVKASEFKKLDYYVAVKLWSAEEYSICGYATGAEVADAPISDFGFAPAHYILLEELHPWSCDLCS